MSAATDISREAGEHFGAAADLSFEDAVPGRLRYHLLRLTLAGLTREDVHDLGELGRLAFQESDVKQQADRIKQRTGASPLAFAIADILERAGSGVRGPVSLRAAMLGAVLGAYVAMGGSKETEKPASAALGAVGGAVAMSTGTVIREGVEHRSWQEYLHMEE
jgi:hypothetical protein